MTDLIPTGDIVRTPAGVDLVLTRTYSAPIADVWASVTEPERTARWFGAWRGEPGPGRTVQVQMAFEESAPWFDVVIESCAPPRHLVLVMGDGAGASRLELELGEVAGADPADRRDPGSLERADLARRDHRSPPYFRCMCSSTDL